MVSKNSRRRVGLATLELVIATTLTFPLAAFLLYLAARACHNLYQVIATLVEWPYL
ncbi:MAG: hypothetical protein K2R98_17780 [Gemmataceae bacterium]|nr:hypothetical protein [Gemmataceae bacterium]